MSIVTTVVILAPLGEPELEELNDAIAPLGNGAFTDVGKNAGGPKHPQARIMAAAFNGLSWRRFLNIVTKLPWPDETLMAVQFEDDHGFAIHPMRDIFAKE